MPLYEYECVKHGRFELIRKFSDPPVKKCPTCGQKVEKLLSSPAIQFKGTGWYVTDYAGKGKEPAAAKDKDKGSTPKGDGAKESAKSTSDSAPASKPAEKKASSGSSSSS